MSWRLLKSFVCILILAALAACAKPPDALKKEPDLQIISMQITPALNHWLPYVAACAEDIQNFGIYTQVIPHTELSINENDLILRLGKRQESDPFAFVMGSEIIAVVSGDEVPISKLSKESLAAIFQGNYQSWDEVPELEGKTDEGEQPITVFSYPQGDEVEVLFKETFLSDNQQISQEAQQFFTVESLLSQLEDNPMGLGYSLLSHFPKGLHLIEITGESLDSSQWVLAITKEKPTGSLNQFLLCLQDVQ